MQKLESNYAAIIFFLFFSVFGLSFILGSRWLRPDKEIIVDITGDRASVRTNDNHPGDRFTVIYQGDTIMHCQHDGENWDDIK